MNIQDIQDKFLSLLRALKFKLETLIPIHAMLITGFLKGVSGDLCIKELDMFFRVPIHEI